MTEVVVNGPGDVYVEREGRIDGGGARPGACSDYPGL